MAYSSLENLLEEFSDQELARLTGDPEGLIIDTSRIAWAQNNADAMIDSHLAASYEVPFTGEINPIIRKISVDLTIGNLYDYHYKNSLVPSTIIWRKLNAVKLLGQIRDGNLKLTGTRPGTNAPPLLLSNKENSERIFSEVLLDKFSNYGEKNA
jgi:phage gp36-like protein